MSILTSTMSTVTTTQHNIKHRVKPNDAIYTPKALVDLHYREIYELLIAAKRERERVVNILDPCSGDGAYYRGYLRKFKLTEEEEKHSIGGLKQIHNTSSYNFTSNEITQGKDFLKNNNEGAYDIIIGNLPFSLTEQFLRKSAELKPDVISYIMPVYGLTPARIDMMKKLGYTLTKVKQFKWYVCMGMCCMATWVCMSDFNIYYNDDAIDLWSWIRWKENVRLSYDRRVWYKIDVWAKKKAKKKAREEKKAKKEEEKRIKKLNALRKKVAKSAASIGKKKHKKWWCKTMEIFSKVPTYKITCNMDINPFHIQDEMWKWSYKTKYPKSGRKLWGEGMFKI